MFPLGCCLFILLLASADCQQAEVGEMEAVGKASSKSSLAEFVDNLIDQMNDAKVGMSDILIANILPYR